ncbi:Nicotinamide phosphoribosyltransferase-like 1, partial [Homarus americanus]
MIVFISTGAVACVSDSYDIWKCCEKIWGEELRDAVIKRGKNGGTLLIRPDSGDPPSVVLKVDRDTQKCAYKCSYAVINGEGVDVYKQPISDPSKTSKKGRLALHHVNGTYVTLEGGRSDPKL